MTKVVAIVGPTASGKSQLALAVAESSGGEILSVDSMQVYRGMDIGTAKPDLATRKAVPHHLLDLVDPEDDFSVAEFQSSGRRVLRSLEGVAPAVIVGGSGLHFRALVDPMTFGPTDEALRAELERTDVTDLVTELVAADAAAAAHVDLANPRRVVRAVEVLRMTGQTPSLRADSTESRALRDYRSLVPFVAVGVDPGAGLAARIEARFDAMLAAGLLDEVAGLAERLGRTAGKAVGYKELLRVVAGRATLDEGRVAAVRATVALAKRQRTFFRRDPRIRWLPWHDDVAVRLAAAHGRFDKERVWTS